MRSQTSRLIPGAADSGLEGAEIKARIIRDVRTEDLFPQKYLYANPHGASLWAALVGDPGNPMGKVSRAFPFGRGDREELVEAMRGRIHGSLNGIGGLKRLGVLALGCGDGRREKQICEAILHRGVVDLLNVVLTDISSDLIARATKEFVGLRDKCQIKQASIDFESPVTLREVREELFEEGPVLVLFIGNTLGNLDARHVLNDIRDCLRDGDIVFLETLLHQATDTELLIQGWRKVETDPRVEFVKNPLLLLGIDLRQGWVEERCSAEEDGLLTKTYRYFFGGDGERLVEDTATGATINIDSRSHIDLLQIKSMTKEYFQAVMQGEFAQCDVKVHRYAVGDGKTVTMGYGLAHKEPRPRPILSGWDALAIGIDVEVSPWAWWGCSPCPVDGGRFSMQDAVPLTWLDRPRPQWKALAELLASSETGRQVKKSDAIIALGYAKSGSVSSEVAQHDNLKEVHENLKQVRKAITELARYLRDGLGKLFKCEFEGTNPPILSAGQPTQTTIKSEFKVRFLDRKENGDWQFGKSDG